MILSKQTAQKIIETVKDVCGQNINFIDLNGIIFASNDESRIGKFHEIGKRAIETQEIIEVDSDDSYLGTFKGVSIPFVYKKEILAAIGISGPPDEIRPYVILTQKITSLILKEQEYDSLTISKRSQINYILRSIIENQSINHDLLTDFLRERNLSESDLFRTVVVKLHARVNIANLSIIEHNIYQAFDQFESAIYTFNYPNEYICIISEQTYTKNRFLLKRLAEHNSDILKIGVSSADILTRQNLAYTFAHIAIRSLEKGKNLAIYDELSLDILLGSIPDMQVKLYLNRLTKNLTQEDMTFLKVYYDTDMSLKETAERMFLHKNSVQYKLKRIETQTGFNPRLFRDAVLLYLACQVTKYMDMEYLDI